MEPAGGNSTRQFQPSIPRPGAVPDTALSDPPGAGGIFYDLVKSAGFDNPFGNSFQAYVGEVIKATCPPPRFTALAEQPYYVGRQKKDGVDWILSDSTGHLFIESKTKRLTVDAKTRSDAVALDKDL